MSILKNKNIIIFPNGLESEWNIKNFYEYFTKNIVSFFDFYELKHLYKLF